MRAHTKCFALMHDAPCTLQSRERQTDRQRKRESVAHNGNDPPPVHLTFENFRNTRELSPIVDRSEWPEFSIVSSIFQRVFTAKRRWIVFRETSDRSLSSWPRFFSLFSLFAAVLANRRAEFVPGIPVSPPPGGDSEHRGTAMLFFRCLPRGVLTTVRRWTCRKGCAFHEGEKCRATYGRIYEWNEQFGER